MTTLGFRLTRLLTGRCNIYRAPKGSAAIGSDKKRANATYSLVLSNVPYYSDLTINDNDPSGIGRMKRRQFFTEDNAVMEATVDVQSQDLIRDLTTGAISRVMGDPRRTPGAPGRATDSLYLRLMEEEHPPAELL